MAAVEDLVHFDVVTIFAVTAPIVVAFVEGLVRTARFLDMQDGGEQFETGPRRRLSQHAPDCRIGILQRSERQAGLAVIMLQDPDQLCRSFRRIAP